jgi:hypothetical protein
MHIHAQLKRAGVKLGHYESDLHVEVTPESWEIIKRYEHLRTVEIFPSQLEEENVKLFFDIPFAHDKEIGS